MPASMTRQPAPKGVCRWCDQPILDKNGLPGQRTWHPACVVDHDVTVNPGSTRQAVFQRDHGICACCGLDSEARKRYWVDTERLWYWLARRHFDDEFSAGRIPFTSWGEAYSLARADLARQMKAAGAVSLTESAWQHDHIRPLVDANGDLQFWRLANIQTLCTACHKAKTAREARERAALRKLRPS